MLSELTTFNKLTQDEYTVICTGPLAQSVVAEDTLKQSGGASGVLLHGTQD